MACRGHDVGAFGDRGAALLVHHADQRLAHSQLGNGGGDIQSGVGAHGVGRALDRLLVPRGEGSQGVLHAVTQLGQHAVRNIERVLGHKKHAHALGAHQPHYQFNPLHQHLGRIGKQQVGLVKEEHQLGFVKVADLGQRLEELAQHPEQKCGVQPGRLHQLVGRQNVDDSFAASVGLHEVFDIEHGLAEELIASLAFNLHQAALYGANAGGADVAVLGGVAGGVVAHVLAHGAQVLHVKQQQAVVISDLEYQLQNAGLGVVEVEHARQQQGPEVADRGAHRVALLPEHVPQRGGKGGKGGRL